MRWVVVTPLGMPVEPDVNSTFATVPGPTLACAELHRSAGFYGQQIGEGRHLALSRWIAADDHLHVGRHHGLDGPLEGLAVGSEHKTRRQKVEDVAQLAVVLGDEGVGGRDRHVGDADVHGGKADEGVLDVVAGQDGDRPLRREPAGEQRLADAPRLVQRRGVGEIAPAARRIALGEQHPVGRLCGPVFQPLGQPGWIGPQRVGRAEQERAVGALLHHHVAGPQQDRPEP